MLNKVLQAARKRAIKYLLSGVTRQEFEDQLVAPNERTVEYDFVLQSLLKANPREVLDVGSGTSSLPHMLRICGFHVTAVDNITDYWTGSVFNRHFHVIDQDILRPELTNKFDLVTCISVLEHIQDFDRAVKSMFSLLREGGHLVMTFPYCESKFVENIYSHPEATFGKNVPYICRIFSRAELDAWAKNNGAEIVEQKFYQVYTGQLHTFGDPIFPPLEATKSKLHHLGCVMFRKLPMPIN